MKLASLLLLLGAAAAGAMAQEIDPLKSQACAQALAALQSARDARAGDRAVEGLRGAAAAACLGHAPAAQRPSRVLRAPDVVPPPRIDVPQAAAPVPSPAALPPPVAIQRPPVPVQCDANGCWADDGTHLRQVPPMVPGVCTQVGGVAYCP